MNATAESRSGERQARVLIVEDQKELRRLYAEHLGISGFDVIEAANGVEAIDRASAQQPDVIVMDLSLPILDGWEATRRLKADARTSKIPVIALTAHDGSGELERATGAGCDWFIPKPCPPDALITELRRVLSGEPNKGNKLLDSGALNR